MLDRLRAQALCKCFVKQERLKSRCESAFVLGANEQARLSIAHD
jgi:hypothetical protein